MRVEASFAPSSIVDGLAHQGVVMPPPVDAAARALGDELNAARNGRDDRPDDQRRLPEAFADADAAFAQGPELHPTLALLLVEAAATLARDRRVGPGTTVGDRVVAVLLDAAGSDDAGKLSQ